jgi:hypothetical protein
MTHTDQSASEVQAGPWVSATHEALESSVESEPPHTLPKSATGERTHLPELWVVVEGVSSPVCNVIEMVESGDSMIRVVNGSE